MMSVKLDANLLNTFGQVTWQAKPDYFSSASTDATSQHPVASANQIETPKLPEIEEAKTLTPITPEIKYIFLGAGLDRFWMNEAVPEWQLLLNILNSVNIAVDDVEYYDLSNLHSDDAVFTTLEEVIDSGVDHVFSFDQSGELIEQLMEGLNVVFLPELQHQLMSGHSKKICYQQIITHV